MENQQKAGAKGQMALFGKRRSEMTDAERVISLQDKLYQKAKQEKGYKFYVLYDKLFLPYMLREAWKQVKSNDGAAGIDGISVPDIEATDVSTFLSELSEELRKRT
jgi:hypothetical protein